MTSLTRPVAPHPYDLLPPVPSFTVISEDIADDVRVPDEHTNTDRGENVSPQLSWSGFPEQTQSFWVTCFDPDAPGPAGWWHWTLVDLSKETTSLARGAGSPGGSLPAGAFMLRGDDGEAVYKGAAPPPRDQMHRYFFAVHALDTASLGLSKDAMPGAANTAIVFHTIARALIVPTYQNAG
jgi:Raf kinase inhibitor-like YbhB/YbcL family protein